MTRTQSSVKNLYTALIGQAAGIIISLFARKIFLMCLDEEYLGINGLFSNILSVMSLAELGVGSAMVFSLYKPLAEGNIPVIKSLMRLYKRTYTAIGTAILLLGVLFTPFYRIFMDSVPDIPSLTLIYLLYTLNTGISYFFTYKRSLIICDQKRYIATIYRYVFYFLLNITQIAVLFATKNYVFFMTVQIIFTLAENIEVSRAADRMYPYLREKDIAPLPEDITFQIKRNIRSMFIHKLGGVMVNSTDNILLSKLTGLSSAGIYSNYLLITNALDTVIAQVFSSVSAGVGNLNASDSDKTTLIRSFYRIFFLNFWIYGFSAVCLICLFNPFITLWLGDERLLFDTLTVIIIAARFYVAGIRRTALTYKEAAGAFYYDRHKPLFEIVVNLAASVILAEYMGAAGIFLGTIISSVTVCIWVEPYVLYKYVFHTSPVKYFVRLGLYTAAAAAACASTYFICSLISFGMPFAEFILKMLVCAVLPNLIFFLLFGRSEEFAYFLTLIGKILRSILR